MELRNLYTFIVAGETLNFSKTAKILGYSQAAITIQIQKLEEELGITLFDRIGKNIYLTETGKIILKKAQELKIQIENLSESVEKMELTSGTLRIGLSESVQSEYFLPVLKAFRQKYPNIKLIVKTGIRDYLFEWMIHNELDFAFIIDQNVIANEWDGKIVKTVKVNFVANSQHHLFNKDELTLEDVLQEDLVMTETNLGYCYELAKKLALENQDLEPFLELGDTDFICNMLKTGDYVSYLPEFTVNSSLNHGKLRSIELPQYQTDAYIQFLWHKNKFLTKPMRYLMDLLERQF